MDCWRAPPWTGGHILGYALFNTFRTIHVLPSKRLV